MALEQEAAAANARVAELEQQLRRVTQLCIYSLTVSNMSVTAAAQGNIIYIYNSQLYIMIGWVQHHSFGAAELQGRLDRAEAEVCATIL